MHKNSVNEKVKVNVNNTARPKLNKSLCLVKDKTFRV